jgi:hypothetical protein
MNFASQPNGRAAGKPRDPIRQHGRESRESSKPCAMGAMQAVRRADLEGVHRGCELLVGTAGEVEAADDGLHGLAGESEPRSVDDFHNAAMGAAGDDDKPRIVRHDERDLIREKIRPTRLPLPGGEARIYPGVEDPLSIGKYENPWRNIFERLDLERRKGAFRQERRRQPDILFGGTFAGESMKRESSPCEERRRIGGEPGIERPQSSAMVVVAMAEDDGVKLVKVDSEPIRIVQEGTRLSCVEEQPRLISLDIERQTMLPLKVPRRAIVIHQGGNGHKLINSAIVV